MRQATTQLGFSLVELMIAMVLGLLLLAGVVNVQISSKETFQTSDDLSRVQENGRFALDILASVKSQPSTEGCLCVEL